MKFFKLYSQGLTLLACPYNGLNHWPIVYVIFVIQTVFPTNWFLFLMIVVIPGIILLNHTKTCVSHVLRFAFYSRKVQLWATHLGAFHPTSPTRILSGFKKIILKCPPTCPRSLHNNVKWIHHIVKAPGARWDQLPLSVAAEFPVTKVAITGHRNCLTKLAPV